MFQQIALDKSRLHGISRRQFAESARGMAAALFVINQVYGCSSDRGDGIDGGQGNDAGFEVPRDAMDDEALACEKLLDQNAFVFDVQTHPPSPLPAAWTGRELPMDAEQYLQTLFVQSETTVAVLSGIPSVRDLGLPNVQANALLESILDMAGPRLFFHANVDPNNGSSELDYMAMVTAEHRPAAWKVYPHVGAWRLDSDEVGLPFIEQARALGLPLIAAHRGIAQDAGDYTAPSSPVDLVQAARQYPDVVFLTYHSGWQNDVDEDHPFDPGDPNPLGVDRLVKAVLDNEIGKDGNVYAELGSTWRNLMTSPSAAAHVLGKLLLHLGPDRVVWGTDSVFTGAPQEQIAALRAFQIPQTMQDEFGYPALSDAIKTKIFGLNAAAVYGIDPAAMRCVVDADFISAHRQAHLHDPDAVPLRREKSYGPRTRREFLALRRFEQFFRLG